MALASDRSPSRLLICSQRGRTYRLVPESLGWTLADRDIGFVFRSLGLLDVSEITCLFRVLSAVIKKNLEPTKKFNRAQEYFS